MPNKKPNSRQATRDDIAWRLLGFAALSANLRFNADVWSAPTQVGSPFLLDLMPTKLVAH